MTEPLVLTVKMIGADLAAKDLGKVGAAAEDMSRTLGKTYGQTAEQWVEEHSKAAKTVAKATDDAGKSQGGFFAGLKAGWTRAKADATQSAKDIYKANAAEYDAMAEKQRGFFAGIKDGWDKVKGDAEDGGKKSGDGFLKGIKGKILGGISALGIGAFLVSAVQSAMDSEAVQSQLEDAFSRFPKLADTNIGKIEELANAREKLTRFDADSTKASVVQLAQMRLSGAQITKMIPLIQDYAAKTGKDLDQATKSVTDAFLGNSDALRDISVNFKATGSAGYDYAEMMKALRAQVGGFAEKEGEGANGTLAKLSNQFANVKQELGEKLLPYAIKFGDWIERTGIPMFEKIVDWVAKFGDNIKPLVTYFSSAEGAWVKFTAAIALSAYVFKTHPVFAVAAAVAYIIANWDKVKDAWSGKATELTPATGPDGKPLVSTLPDGRKVMKMNVPGMNHGPDVEKMPGHSKGTVLPGYAPGVDSVAAMLSPGEGVAVPELVKAIGPATFMAWNAAASAGRRGFAFGGIAGTNPQFQRDPISQALFMAQLQSVFSLGSNTATSAAPQVSATPSGDDPVARWKNVATQALQITGDYSSENLSAMMHRLGMESTGNPSAINNWDRNAKNGTPSKGLMQVIDPTFKSYAMPGYDTDIWDPLSNMLASIRYAKATYRTLPAAYNKAGGYDSGGWLPPGGIAVSGLDKPEAVLTPSQWDVAERAVNNHSQGTVIEAGAFAAGAIVISGVSDPEAVLALLQDRLPELLEGERRKQNTRNL
ncbi:lytic transglycosylase domain-containing protein [Nakamurella lactea]|uniref:lytic transglycosylase domain-containing protein n=1 Tax=Nakamurella lactea TaxID=459515 RepID=UPI000426E369|nr:transglycosylase SLT domain-containing protein [Nakamurella lactea]